AGAAHAQLLGSGRIADVIDLDAQRRTRHRTVLDQFLGNSGGGLFNANGELIGIVNAKSSYSEAEGIGFAIPINT
ncbi:trypsin-like serine protease, partial [Gemmiger formicilis]|uniref:trypsin-like serine protease n=1 Tax=Gemmiger formicilis TaxID=745368 RepID=UPI001959E45E